MAIPPGPTGPFVLSLSKDIPSPLMGEGWGEGKPPFVLPHLPVIARSMAARQSRRHRNNLQPPVWPLGRRSSTPRYAPSGRGQDACSGRRANSRSTTDR